MKCPKCQSENPENAKFCGKCRAKLLRVCAQCGTENSPANIFCNECGHDLQKSVEQPAIDYPQPKSYTPKHLADRILQSRSALEGERKQVTVLFADVKGSMELAEQVDPEEWHRILDRFFQILADGIHRFEGTINQYTGDGIMALFGAPIAHEDHAQRACWAALYLRDELRRYADEVRRGHGLSFSVRMGLNSGGVVVGRIGDDLRMDYTAQGHVVGLAARMQEVAEPGRVYLTANTRDLVSGYFELRDLGSLRVKGLQEPSRAFDLERAGRLRTRLDLSRARGFTRFVGRGHEMSRLDSVLAQVLEGKGVVVGVVGEAGVGKSRLCLEFVEDCRAQGISIYEAHCPAHGKSIPFLPVFELLRSYFGITELDGPVETRRKIAGTLILLDEAFQEALPLVFDFLGVPDPERPAPTMDPDARQRQLFAFVRQLIEARSRQEPAVMLLDDLHWIDAGSDAFVAQAVEATAGTRTLLLTNFRPEYDAPWMDRSHYQQISLLPLSAEAVSELLDDLLGQDPSLAGLREKIQERTGGNPFFVEEIFQSLVEQGTLQGSRGAYRLLEPIEELALPATVETVLAARIDRLSEREKRVLQIASVIGREVPEPILRAVAQLPDSELAGALATLTAAEFLHEKALYPEAEYVFKHQLTREVAYGSQLAERRKALHQAVAFAIEELRPAKLDEEAALLAHHSEQAGNALDAARWHRRAALWIGVSDAAESVRHWRRVHELCESMTLAEETSDLALEACFRILIIGWRFGLGRDEINEIFQSGMRLAEAMQDVRAQARLLDGYATAWGVVSWDWEEAIPYVNQAIELAESVEDRGLLLALHQRLCFALMQVGRHRDAISVADRALDWSEGDIKLGADVIGWSPNLLLMCLRAYSLMILGRLEQAAAELDGASELARSRDEPEIIWWAKCFLVVLARIKGDFSEMLFHARQLAELADRQGHPIFRGWSYGILAAALAGCAQWDAAAEAVRQWQEHQVAGAGSDSALPALARTQLAFGESAAARNTVQEALVEADRLKGMRNNEIAVRMDCAEMLLEIDGVAAKGAVERELQAVQAFVEDSGAISFRPRIQEARGKLALLLGDGDEYKSRLREAHRLYAEMRATGHAERLARELGI
jgi:class 3 adenylate cyclase/tetratricopeptide (TPR) repeat protein